MQRKIPNINFRDKLHSIPISKMKNVKCNVLYSIPGVCALLLLGLTTLLSSNSCYAASASLTIDDSDANNKIISETINAAPGSTAYSKEYNIKINASDIESYSLTISGNPILNGSNGGSISGTDGTKNGNTLGDNTWGYAYGNSTKETMIYHPVSTTGTKLEGSTVSTGTVSSSNKLVFAAKFASTNANSGTYSARVSLSLVATPKKVLSWNELVYMQDMNPAACAEAPMKVTKQLIDKRNTTTYDITKLDDGRCWMSQNLQIAGPHVLTSSDSNVSANYPMPASDITAFNGDNTTQAVYAGDLTTYYSWCAATAGTCENITADGTQAPSSICPKGWTLPTGGANGAFQQLYNASKTSQANSTYLQSAPYNFKKLGSVRDGKLLGQDSSVSGGPIAYYWSGTSKGESTAYNFCNDSSFNLDTFDYGVEPAQSSSRSSGMPVRCVADTPEPKTYTITYEPNGGHNNSTDTQTCSNVADFCTTEIPANSLTPMCYQFLGWDTNKNVATPTYKVGDKITITGDTTLYGIWGTENVYCSI